MFKDDELYDEARGPEAPVTRRRVAGEWDDPTWIAVEVTDWFKGLSFEPEPEDPRWLTIKAAALLLPVSAQTIGIALRGNLWPVRTHRVGGWRLWREDVEALAALIEANPSWSPLRGQWSQKWG